MSYSADQYAQGNTDTETNFVVTGRFHDQSRSSGNFENLVHFQGKSGHFIGLEEKKKGEEYNFGCAINIQIIQCTKTDEREGLPWVQQSGTMNGFFQTSVSMGIWLSW